MMIDKGSALLSPDVLRARFAAALSALYRQEVPHYGALLDIVAEVNAGAAEPRLGAERHGAIRLGSAEELRLIARAFAVLGMEPVDYYDLASAGVPVHSTAFRPVTATGLAASPFRMFTSLLRLELVEDERLRTEAAERIAGRHILSAEALALIERAEAAGGLGEGDAERFVAALVEIFRWRQNAPVDSITYRRFHAAHPLLADVVCFAGPHLNHLTPRTLDIEAVQRAMPAHGIAAKAVIEGPPPRAVPILLRQTSFRAVAEPIRFSDGQGTHTARFGEVEQRGLALTPAGRTLYDRLLADGRLPDFPDDLPAIRAAGLGYFRGDEPILYEDFLPVSAAGIFRSNLAGVAADAINAAPARDAFAAALGRPPLDPFALYAADAAQG